MIPNRLGVWTSATPAKATVNADGVVTGVAGGTSVITVLAYGDHPEWYGLPKDPSIPWTIKLWKNVLRPFGFIAIVGAIVGAFGHHLYHGNKGHIDPAPLDDEPPQA